MAYYYTFNFYGSPFIFIPDTSFFKVNGFLDKTLTLTAALTGFYIAALVAAATFTNAALDKVIKSGPTALITKNADGRRVKDFLTRREFACMIFGYLSFASLAISLIAVFFIGMSTANRGILEHWKWVGCLFSDIYWSYTRAFVIVPVCLAISHLAVVTSLGLYYLMDRLYRMDRQITTQKAAEDGPDAAAS